MQRKVFRNGQEQWEDLGPGRARRHTPRPSEGYLAYMENVTSVDDARRELEAHVIPLVVAARERAQQDDSFDIAA
jgi:hypothetical protein